VVAVVGAEESPTWALGDGQRWQPRWLGVPARGGRTDGNVWLGEVLRVLGKRVGWLAGGES
jgi:hypothetical protein